MNGDGMKMVKDKHGNKMEIQMTMKMKMKMENELGMEI